MVHLLRIHLPMQEARVQFLVPEDPRCCQENFVVKGKAEEQTELGCHSEKVKVLVILSCLTLCGSVDCSPPGSSVYGILQARILE